MRRNHQLISISALLGCALAFGCGSTESDPPGEDGADSPDASTAESSDSGPSDMADAPEAASALPAWQLEDIQPESSRFGETYGLSTFANQVIVVVLVEGF